MTTSSCPTDEELFPLGLGEAAEEAIERHVQDCAACGSRVPKIRAEIAVLNKLVAVSKPDPTSVTLDLFIARVAESSLVSEPEMRKLLASFADAERPQSAEQLARELVTRKKLTVYQAQQSYLGKGKTLILGCRK